MAMLMAAQGHEPVLSFRLLGATAVALAIAVGEGSSIPGNVLQTLRAPLKLLHITFRGVNRSPEDETNVLPLEEGDLQQDLCTAGVLWELSPVALARLRFEDTLSELRRLHKDMHMQKSSSRIQKARRAAKVWALKEAERQTVEAEHARTRAQENADRRIAEGAEALRNAISRVNELEKQMAHVEKGSKYVTAQAGPLHDANPSFVPQPRQQQAWRVHTIRRQHAAFRNNTAAQVTLGQAQLLQQRHRHQLGASQAAYKQAAARLSEAERSRIVAEDQQTVQDRACRELEEQVAAGQQALTEALGRHAAAERALLLEADAAKVCALKEAERQTVEAEQARTRAQENADRRIAEGAEALRNAISRVNELEKQMAHSEKGSKCMTAQAGPLHGTNPSFVTQPRQQQASIKDSLQHFRVVHKAPQTGVQQKGGQDVHPEPGCKSSNGDAVTHAHHPEQGLEAPAQASTSVVPQQLDTPSSSFFGTVTKLVSPGWDAVAKARAAADAEEDGEVWDGNFTMIAMPNNPCIRMIPSDRLSVIGEGAQGIVLYGEAIIGGVVTALAVKVVHTTSPHIAALAEQEVQALKAVLGTKHILQYVHHTSTAARDMLVLSTRFEEGRNVSEVISGLVSRARKNPQLQAQHLLLVKKSFRQMLEGLQGLHACGRAHGDLKPSNLFMRDQQDLPSLHCSLHDPGGSRLQSAGVEGAIWSTSYISPQMLRATNGRRISVDLLANDMWAMGVVLVCLLAGYLIFGINGEDGPELVAKCRDEKTLQDVAMAKLLQWEVEWPRPKTDAGAYPALSKMLSGADLHAAWHFVCLLLHPQQELRLTVTQALQADFLQL